MRLKGDGSLCVDLVMGGPRGGEQGKLMNRNKCLLGLLWREEKHGANEKRERARERL